MNHFQIFWGGSLILSEDGRIHQEIHGKISTARPLGPLIDSKIQSTPLLRSFWTSSRGGEAQWGSARVPYYSAIFLGWVLLPSGWRYWQLCPTYFSWRWRGCSPAATTFPRDGAASTANSQQMVQTCHHVWPWALSQCCSAAAGFVVHPLRAISSEWEAQDLSDGNAQVHCVKWWMGHYNAKTPKRHYAYSNSRVIHRIDKGRLQGWKPPGDKVITAKRYQETMNVQYIWAIAISASPNRSGSRTAGRTKQFEFFCLVGHFTL